MEIDETVLSDVHLYTDNCSDDESRGDDIKIVVSRLKFTQCQQLESVNKMPSVDVDGDFEVVRPVTRVVCIQHALSTRLELVGLQVWNGALLLADFILDKTEKWTNQTVLELGAGTGLCSILLSMSSKLVFCTDTGETILNTCQKNIDANPKLKRANVLVRELNWSYADHFTANSGPFSWRPDDIKSAAEIFYIFASDVIYDDDLTDAFFDLLLGWDKCFCLFVSLEKRLNFTLSSMEVAAPAYTHYRQRLAALDTDNCYAVEQLKCEFPQYFTYERTKYLELWRICKCTCTNCVHTL